MSTLYLGRGNDVFVRTSATPDFPDGSSLFGNNGDDSITLGDGSPRGFKFSYVFVSGGNGDDTVQLFGRSSLILGGNGEDTLRTTGVDNWLYGGRGDDVLGAAIGNGNLGNHLFGGPGDDHLSASAPPVLGLLANNTLSGGPGCDSFDFSASGNLSNVHVEGKSGGTVEAGDVVIGNFNLVTDYEAGEEILLLATTAVEGDVGLGGTGGLLLPDWAYAVIRGDFNPATVTRFTVDPEGADLLLVFDREDGVDSSFQGSTVLLGFTAAEDLLIA